MNRFPAFLAVLFFCLPGQGGAGAEGAPKTKAQRRGPGRVAVVDPATGRLVTPSAAQRVDLGQGRAVDEDLNFSHEGLAEVSLPEGGYKLDLQGRFRMSVVAAIGPDGKLRIGHPVSATPVTAGAVTAPKATKEGHK